MREKPFILVNNFIDDVVKRDLESGAIVPPVCTRVPPEPNGYLHLGHVKSICINFGIARRYNGKCFLYFDDTNPLKEKDEYVQAIKQDIEWLGFKWDKLYFASDHYQDLYDIAVDLIKMGKAFVCHLSADEVRDTRGTLTEPGRESPYRNRSIEENLDLFARMKNGEFPEGHCTLRAKIDMASPILCMRDPVIFRIMHAEHFRTGKKWCIYPMYDFASPILDSIGGVTTSLCGPEFEERRPLYNWSAQVCGRFKYPSRQTEFAKLNVKNVVLGKRYLKALIDEGKVSGWDDPRMPTIIGMRRRGYPAEALKDFINAAGVAKALSEVDYALLEHCVRENLKANTECRMAVIKPVKLIIDNYKDSEILTVENGPDKGVRKVSMSRELWIESEDFMAEPVPKYFRLFPGNEVRLKGAYIIKCTSYNTDSLGNVEVHAEYYPETKSGKEQLSNQAAGAARRVKATIHWVDAAAAILTEFRLYEQNSLEMETTNGYIEASLEQANAGDSFQFIRSGYFIKDKDSGKLPVFNRIVSLKSDFKI